MLRSTPVTSTEVANEHSHAGNHMKCQAWIPIVDDKKETEMYCHPLIMCSGFTALTKVIQIGVTEVKRNFYLFCRKVAVLNVCVKSK